MPIVTDNENHTRMRKLLSHAFSDSALREQEPLIQSYCNLLITRLYDQIEGPSKGKVDIVSWLNFTTFDILGDLAFGESFLSLENGEHHDFVSTIFGSLKGAAVLRLLNGYTITRLILHALLAWVPAMGKARKDLDSYTVETVTKRLEKQTDRKDFLR
jgi:cytochrome P450